jgi:maltose alpha-D-glucosyltransferase/alpha-amylase
MRSVIHVRRAHPVFGLGKIRVLDTDNEGVLAFVRTYEGDGTYHGPRAETVLCVFSFSHNPVHVTIDAQEFAGAEMRDLFGGGQFPTIAADGRFSLTFGTQSFYWLQVGQH